jgi:hypothetical protein
MAIEKNDDVFRQFFLFKFGSRFQNLYLKILRFFLTALILSYSQKCETLLSQHYYRNLIVLWFLTKKAKFYYWLLFW